MTSYPITIHTRGATYSRAGLYALPAGTWTASAVVRKPDGTLIETLAVNFAALSVPDAAGNTHALSVLATAAQTALWPLAALLQDVLFTDASTTPVIVPAVTTIITVSAHTAPINEADNPLQTISPDLAPVLRGATGPTGAASTVPGPTGPAGPGVPAGGTTGQVLAKASAGDNDTAWVDQTGGGGTGATNLAYTASATGGTVTSDTGTDATLPLADGTTAGLMAPAQHSKLAGIATGATAVTVDATPTDGSANAVASNGVFDALAGKSDTGHTHTGTYDPAGTATSAVAAHASASDPHGDRAFAAAADAAVASAAAADATSKANAAAAASTPAAHAGAGGTAHANAVAGGAAGFISGADQSKLDGIAAGAQVNPASTDALTEGSTNLYHTAARVRAAVLTGLSTAAATVVDATHTVLQAIGFLQKQVSDNASAISGKAASGAITASGLTMSTAKLLGRGTASTGAVEELTIGSGLTLSAGTLSASGGGSFDPASPGPIGATTPSTIAATGVTVTGGTVTSSTPTIDAAQTWNNSAVAFTARVVNVTNTASAAGSLIDDLRVDGSSKYAVRKDGRVLLGDGNLTSSSAGIFGQTAMTTGIAISSGGGNPEFAIWRNGSLMAKVTNVMMWNHINISLAGDMGNTGVKLWSPSAGLIEINSGTNGTYRDLKLRNLISSGGVITLASFTVATLPSASTSGAGAMAYATDANATTYRSTVAAGGSNKVQVTSDGTNWIITG